MEWRLHLGPVAAVATAALVVAQVEPVGSTRPTAYPAEQAPPVEEPLELERAGANLHRSVVAAALDEARRFGVRIDGAAVVCTVLERGLVAGAPQAAGDAVETAATDGRGEPPGAADPPDAVPRAPAADGVSELEGLVLVAGAIVPDGAQEQGSAAYEVRCDRDAKRVELVTLAGEVALAFPLIEVAEGARPEGVPLEAGGGEPEGANRWRSVYASVVCGLMGSTER